ncbi:MAG: 4'-phosphopantetheinyl transferase superfamily protein [Chloroflexi bacterium]|nr:MAG: 4'-phosphopantetheinyl transferase superfamily protein [Chloroflexota bacterium]
MDKEVAEYNTFMELPHCWSPLRAAIAAEPGWVHVFRLALDLPAERLGRLAATLTEDERARAARYMREIDRQRFIAARGQMRAILAAYLGAQPGELRFHYNPQGKPALAEGEPRFNLSHSDRMGLLAVAFGQEVGVDVERLDRNVDYANIIRRFFAPGEVAEFLSLPGEDQPRAFCNGWTRKEAYIKARGMGMAFRLDDFEVSLAPGKPARLSAPDPGWTLYALDPGEGFAAALVVEGQIKGIRCWEWDQERDG